jgi:hypothetical protein
MRKKAASKNPEGAFLVKKRNDVRRASIRRLTSGDAGNRTRVREKSGTSSFTCVAALTQAAGFLDSARTCLHLISIALSGAYSHDPAFVLAPFRYQDNLTVGRPGLKRPGGLRCRSQLLYVPFLSGREPLHANALSFPTSKPIVPMSAVGFILQPSCHLNPFCGFCQDAGGLTPGLQARDSERITISRVVRRASRDGALRALRSRSA